MLLKKDLPFKLKKADFRLNPQCRKFLGIGLPLALQEFLTQFSFLALCAFVNRLGLEASSGYGVACKIVNFAMLIPSALMQSMASFVSQNVGAGKHKRARQAMFTGMGVGLALSLIHISIWICCGFLLVSFALMFIREDLEENPVIEKDLTEIRQETREINHALKQELQEEHRELKESTEPRKK